MEYMQPVNRAAVRADVGWRPGCQTAADLRDEWYEEHGWLATPSPETLAHWAEVKEAEEAYAADRTTREPASEMTDSSPATIDIEFPEVVYLPCAEPFDYPSAARVDMRETHDGRTALLTYSGLDELRYCCGDDQAWITMPTAELGRLQKAHPFQLLMLDVSIPHELRRGQE